MNFLVYLIVDILSITYGLPSIVSFDMRELSSPCFVRLACRLDCTTIKFRKSKYLFKTSSKYIFNIGEDDSCFFHLVTGSAITLALFVSSKAANECDGKSLSYDGIPRQMFMNAYLWPFQTK